MKSPLTISAILLCTSVLLAQGNIGSVTFHVVDPTGAEILKAVITAEPANSDSKMAATTDARGTASLNLQPGAYDAYVMAQDFAPRTLRFNVASGSTRRDFG